MISSNIRLFFTTSIKVPVDKKDVKDFFKKEKKSSVNLTEAITTLLFDKRSTCVFFLIINYELFKSKL
jgi:hypothetical protein